LRRRVSRPRDNRCDGRRCVGYDIEFLLRRLRNRPETKTKILRSSNDWLTANSTERQHTFCCRCRQSLVTVFGYPRNLKFIGLYRNGDSVRCARNGLTVSAVTNNDVGIYVRLIAVLVAMIRTINFSFPCPVPSTRERPLCAASSTDRCNTFCELLSRRLIEQGLSRPFIELPCDGTELGLTVQGQIGATRKILAQQSVGVFV
jgi:hypothetical protein